MNVDGERIREGDGGHGCYDRMPWGRFEGGTSVGIGMFNEIGTRIV